MKHHRKTMVQTIDFLFTIYIRALIAKVADSTRLHELVPKINTESLETLLGTISASMLVSDLFCGGLDGFSIFGSK
jgi:hypothetical protein